MKTDQKTMAAADWDKIERETVEKIRLLKAVVQELQPGPLSDKVCADLVMPCLAILAEFNLAVRVDDSEPDIESPQSRPAPLPFLRGTP